MRIEDAFEAVVCVLPRCDDLRMPPWRGDPNPFRGHCYVASEAVMELADDELLPWVLRVPNGGTHWFLRTQAGTVVDPTRAQFCWEPFYNGGHRNGMMRPGRPSRRAREMLDRIRS